MAGKSIYTKSLGRQVARNARSAAYCKYHVIPSHAEKWSVVADGRVRPVRAFRTRQEAISFAKKFAGRQNGSEVVVHGFDGRISSRAAF